MTIIEIKENTALAEARGVRTEVNTALVQDLKTGDRVIVHAGFIIEKLDPAEAEKTEKLLEEYEKSLYDEDIV